MYNNNNISDLSATAGLSEGMVQPTKVVDVNTNKVIASVKDVYVGAMEQEAILELQHTYEDWYQRNKDYISSEFDPNL